MTPLLRRWTPALLFTATFVAFLPALRNEFVNWDDTINFVNNPDFRGLGPAQIRWMFTRFHSAHYMPVSWLTLGLDYELWGLHPFGYHLTNLLLHCANAVLFFFLGRRFIGDSGAAFAALFFSLHPLRVESVAWATERRDVLSGFFYLATLILYLRRRTAAAWAVFLLAMLSKVTSLTLPAVLVILDVYALGRIPRERRAWLEKVPFVLTALAFAVVGIFAQNSSSRALVPLGELTPLWRLGQAGYALVFYAWKTLVPYPLSPWYESYLLTPGLAALCASAVAVAFATLYAGRKRYPWALAAAAFYAAVLFPALGIVKSGRQLVADRYSYLPCLAFALLAGAALRKASRPVWAAACLWLAVLGAMTWRQTTIWKDTASLWSYALKIDPGSPFSHVNLAIGLMQDGHDSDAIREIEGQMDHFKDTPNAKFLAAVEARAHSNLAVDLAAKGDEAAALEHFKDALRLDPSLAETRNNLGLFYYRQGKVAQAVLEFETALNLDPAFAEAHNNLGIALAKQGRLRGAEAHFERALQILPDHPGARANLTLAQELLRKKR